MSKIVGLTATLTPRGELPATLTTTDAGAVADGVGGLVDSLTVEWGRPSCREHARPGRAEVTLSLHRTHQTPLYEACLEVVAEISDGESTERALIVRGWVSSYVALTSRWSDLVSYRLSLMDVLALADATKIIPDWPVQQSFQRWWSVADAAPTLVPPDMYLGGRLGSTATGPGGETQQGYPWVAGRSGEPVSVAAAARGVILASGAWLDEGPDGLMGNDGAWHVPAWPTGQGQLTLLGPGVPRTAAPLSAVEDTPRTLDRTTAITQVSVSYVSPTGDVRETLTRPTTLISTSAAALTTELYGDGIPPILRTIATGWLAYAPEPVQTMGPARVDLSQLPAADAARLVRIGQRTRTYLALDGAPDPHTSDTHAVIGGRLTITTDDPPDTELLLSLEPSGPSGARPWQFDDFPTTHNGNFVPITFGVVSPDILIWETRYVLFPRRDV